MRLLVWIAGNVQYYGWELLPDFTADSWKWYHSVMCWVDDRLCQPIFRQAFGEVEPEYNQDDRHHPYI